MPDTPQDKAFKKELIKRRKRKVEIQAATAKAMQDLFDTAGKEIQIVLAGAPTDWQSWYLPQLEKSIRAAMDEFATEGQRTLGAAAEDAFKAGIDLVDEPLKAAGVTLIAEIPHVDIGQLAGMQGFLTGRIKDISATVAAQINTEMGLVMLGVQSTEEAAKKVGRILETGGMRRARGIIRTEIGGAFSVATQARQSQVAEYLPGMKKQWRRSGKVHSRLTHDAADGQIREVDEPFIVGGVKLRYPRDVKAPIKHRINCGCDSLPYMEHWEVRSPGARPFSKAELARSRNKRRLDQVRATSFDTWVKRISGGKIRPSGAWETTGALSGAVKDALQVRGVLPASHEIAVSDRQIAHMLRDAKKARGAALPERIVRKIPELMEAPKAVLLDRRAKAPTLLYVFDVPGEDRLGKLVVRVKAWEKKSRHRAHNWTRSGGLVDGRQLQDGNQYEILDGEI